tara:strand:- start:885 stop:1091 length:207 start_codon:yes stop_codon:yes gene_type:complete
MPTPEQYEQSRNQIRQQIREKLGMKTPSLETRLDDTVTEPNNDPNPLEAQILEELRQIKLLLQKLVAK